MKSEPKAFASLSSGLLARKGAARPAMRPQGFGQATGNLDDLGWNDMGFEPPKPSSTPLRDVHAAEDAEAPARVPFAGLTPLESPVHSQQAEIADRLSSIGDRQFEEEVPEAADPVDFAPEAAQPAAEQVDFAEQAADDFAEEQEAYVPTLAEQQIAVPSAVVTQSAAVAAPKPKAAVVPSPRTAPRARSVQGSKGKAAFTLRLDPERHLKLRLACAVGARSAQQLVTDALDQLLASMPELDAMAENAKRKGS